METRAPGKYVLLYDGRCAFCRAQLKRVKSIVPRGVDLEYRDYHAENALDDFPGIREEDCDRAMHLVSPEGHVYRGAEAATRIVMTRRWLSPVCYMYYTPVLRAGFDRAYDAIARRRFALAKERGEIDCDGACDVHAGLQKRSK